MNQASFEHSVQDSLDLHQDPLDSAEVLAYLDTHPEALESFVNLRAVGLHTTWPPSAAQPKLRLWKVAPFAAAAAILLMLTFKLAEDPVFLEPMATSSSPIILAQAPVAKFVSMRITRTASQSQSSISSETTGAARILSMSARTTQNIH